MDPQSTPDLSTSPSPVPLHRRRRRPRHHGHRHRRGPGPGRPRGHRHRHQRGRGPRRPSPPWRPPPPAPCSAGGSPSGSGRTSSPASAPSPTCRPPPTPTWSSRWCRRTTRSSSRSSPRWTPIVRPDTILATGTNALSVTRLAADSARPERVLGLHFFNPAPAMKLVEVVSSVLTAPAGRRRGHRRSPASWARSRSRSATGPDSSPTGCCSATSTRPPRCTSRGTPPARTSTPRCSSAAGCRWARWPCST